MAEKTKKEYSRNSKGQFTSNRSQSEILQSTNEANAKSFYRYPILEPYNHDYIYFNSLFGKQNSFANTAAHMAEIRLRKETHDIEATSNKQRVYANAIKAHNRQDFSNMNLNKAMKFLKLAADVEHKREILLFKRIKKEMGFGELDKDVVSDTDYDTWIYFFNAYVKGLKEFTKELKQEASRQSLLAEATKNLKNQGKSTKFNYVVEEADRLQREKMKDKSFDEHHMESNGEFSESMSYYSTNFVSAFEGYRDDYISFLHSIYSNRSKNWPAVAEIILQEEGAKIIEFVNGNFRPNERAKQFDGIIGQIELELDKKIRSMTGRNIDTFSMKELIPRMLGSSSGQVSKTDGRRLGDFNLDKIVDDTINNWVLLQENAHMIDDIATNLEKKGGLPSYGPTKTQTKHVLERFGNTGTPKARKQLSRGDKKRYTTLKTSDQSDEQIAKDIDKYIKKESQRLIKELNDKEFITNLIKECEVGKPTISFMQESMSVTEKLKNKLFVSLRGEYHGKGNTADDSIGVLMTKFPTELDNKKLQAQLDDKIEIARKRLYGDLQELVKKKAKKSTKMIKTANGHKIPVTTYNYAATAELDKEIEQQITAKLGSIIKGLEKQGVKIDQDLRRFFYFEESDKYLTNFQGTGHFKGVSLGANLNAQLDNLQKLLKHIPEEYDYGISNYQKNWLQLAVLNSNENMIGHFNKNPLEQYFSSFMGMLMFDGAYNDVDKTMKAAVDGVTGTVQKIHLYNINGIYFPASYILSKTYNDLVEANNAQLQLINGAGTGGYRVRIVNTLKERNEPYGSADLNDSDPWAEAAQEWIRVGQSAHDAAYGGSFVDGGRVKLEITFFKSFLKSLESLAKINPRKWTSRLG